MLVQADVRSRLQVFGARRSTSLASPGPYQGRAVPFSCRKRPGNGLTPTTLSSKTLDVQGSFVGAELEATKVKLDE